ncbi:MAG: phosphoserine phosphatase SerB, partial [Pseudomonadota bacterium]
MANVVLTLIAGVPSEPLTTSDIAGAIKALSETGAETAEPTWLDEGIAIDIPLRAERPTAIETALRGHFSGRPIDLAVLPKGARRKHLLVADMDSTIIEVECLDELADFAGLKDRVAAITERAMRGELDFDEALRERVGLLKGLEETALHR